MKQKKFDQILLVEGNDDKHVMWALLVKFEINQNFEVIDADGINNLYDQLPIRFKESGIKTIGVIIDADSNLASRWDQVKNLVSKANIGLPDHPEIGGTIIGGDIKFGIWLMPNNNTNGMLEDFIRFLVPEDDTLLPIANSTLNVIEEKGFNKYSTIHKPKALIHSWLAWQEDPGTPLGLAITKKYLNTDEKNCAAFVEWIKQLYS